MMNNRRCFILHTEDLQRHSTTPHPTDWHLDAEEPDDFGNNNDDEQNETQVRQGKKILPMPMHKMPSTWITRLNLRRMKQNTIYIGKKRPKFQIIFASNRLGYNNHKIV